MFKRILSALLVSTFCLTAVACSNGADDTAETTAGDTTVADALDTTAEADGFEKDTLDPSLNFKNETVSILVREAIANTEYFVEQETGEVVDDALYERNITIEERLGVKLNFISMPGEWSDREVFNGAIRQSVHANDGAYDICAVLSNQLATLTLEGLLTNLNTLDHLSFDKPWWSAGLLDELEVDDKLYFASGDASLGLINGMMCVFYNKDMCVDFSIPDMYEIVNNGEWTLDKAVELSKGVYDDLNGNNVKDASDRLGFTMGDYNQLYGFIDSFDLKIVENVDGIPTTLIFDNEKVTSAAEKLISLFKDNTDFALSWDAKEANLYAYRDAFAADKVLFSTGEFKYTDIYREIDAFDYGVIPFPKWDENQSDYRTTVRGTYSNFCIPVTVQDPDMAAAVLECFASESYRTVSPAYFETALKIKYSRDDETAQMFDLIKGSVVFQFATSFNRVIGSPLDTFKNNIGQFNEAWTSLIASWMPESQIKLEEAIEIIRDLP